MKKNESPMAAKASCNTPACTACDRCRVVSYQTLPGHKSERKEENKSLYNAEVVLYDFYFVPARGANYAV